MDYTQVTKLNEKKCETDFPCDAVMPGPEATDEERATYYKLPCHEKRAKCYEKEIEEMNALFMDPYNKKMENISIAFGVGMGVLIVILVIIIVIFARKTAALEKNSKANKA